MNSLPRWVPPDLVEQVFERAGFNESLSLIDETLTERIAAAFFTHPWVKDVHRVSKTFPAQVQVELVFREPVAMVKGIDGYYPIDGEGVLLPHADFSVADIDRYPTIERISSAPLGDTGESWGDPVVLGAAQLAELFNQKDAEGRTIWNSLGLKSIIAPSRVSLNDTDDLEYRIQTAGGSQIAWGRSPATQHPGEVSVTLKLERMVEYHQMYDGFDSSGLKWVIDVRPWKSTLRSRMASHSDTNRTN